MLLILSPSLRSSLLDVCGNVEYASLLEIHRLLKHYIQKRGPFPLLLQLSKSYFTTYRPPGSSKAKPDKRLICIYQFETQYTTWYS